MLADEIVEALRSRLLELEQTPDGPHYDAEWLRLRCEDTLRGATEHWRSLSLRQLKKDVADFDAEFPGLLAPALVEALEHVPLPRYYAP